MVQNQAWFKYELKMMQCRRWCYEHHEASPKDAFCVGKLSHWEEDGFLRILTDKSLQFPRIFDIQASRHSLWDEGDDVDFFVFGVGSIASCLSYLHHYQTPPVQAIFCYVDNSSQDLCNCMPWLLTALYDSFLFCHLIVNDFDIPPAKNQL